MLTGELPESRTRNLDELQREVGNLTTIIEARIASGKGPVRIAEIGFGYGAVLVDLVEKYGDKVELHGFNLIEGHGNITTIREIARRRNFNSPLLDKINLHYFDVCTDWPFDDDQFDLIYSQSVFLHLPDRVKTFHEMNRTLKPGGIARVEACLVRPKLSSEYRMTFVVMDGDREISFEDYSKKFSNIRFKKSGSPLVRQVLNSVKQWLRKVRNSRKVPIPRQPYMEMTKGNPFNLGLTLENNIELRETTMIKKSIYRVNGEAQYPNA